MAALLARLDSLWSCATPGEWEVLPAEGVWASSPTACFGTFVTTLDDLTDEDAAAVVALHNAWPEVAAVVRRQAATLAAVEALAEEYALTELPPDYGVVVAAELRAALTAGDDGQTRS